VTSCHAHWSEGSTLNSRSAESLHDRALACVTEKVFRATVLGWRPTCISIPERLLLMDESLLDCVASFDGSSDRCGVGYFWCYAVSAIAQPRRLIIAGFPTAVG
jgi:hypothetical protein